MTMARRVDIPADLAAELNPGIIPLQSDAAEFFDEMRGLQLLKRSLTWSAAFYKIWTNRRILPVFIPGNQFVQSVSDSKSFWPVRRAKAKGVALADGCDGLDDGAEEPDVDEGEPDDPDDVADPDGIEVDEGEAYSEEESEEEADAGVEGHALSKVKFADGASISFYRDGRFEAVCRHCDHGPMGRCRLTRTSRISDDALESAQGRPLGLLSSWLLSAKDYNWREEHGDMFAVYCQTLPMRQNARRVLMGLHGSRELANHERAQRPGEPEEPVEWA
jgi:hypothetical protein